MSYGPFKAKVTLTIDVEVDISADSFDVAAEKAETEARKTLFAWIKKMPNTDPFEAEVLELKKGSR